MILANFPEMNNWVWVMSHENQKFIYSGRNSSLRPWLPIIYWSYIHLSADRCVIDDPINLGVTSGQHINPLTIFDFLEQNYYYKSVAT